MKNMKQQIIDFIDVNDGATYAAVSITLNVGVKGLRAEFDKAFRELLEDGDIRIIKRNNIGVPTYHLAA